MLKSRPSPLELLQFFTGPLLVTLARIVHLVPQLERNYI